MDAHTSATISRTGATHGRRSATARATFVAEAPAASFFAPLPDALCPTCLAEAEGSGGDTHPGVLPATCPTCGVTSLEYGLTLAIDATLADMAGLQRLDEAL